MQPLFHALSEPNRLQIVELLRRGPRAVGEIQASLRLRQPQVSKHLKVLQGAGMVAVTRDAQRRIYELRPEPLAALDRWLEPYRRFWNRRLDMLEAHLDATAEKPGPSRRTRRA
jgi:DNA-binding transcriptional ArsR family regulator